MVVKKKNVKKKRKKKMLKKTLKKKKGFVVVFPTEQLPDTILLLLLNLNQSMCLSIVNYDNTTHIVRFVQTFSNH